MKIRNLKFEARKEKFDFGCSFRLRFNDSKKDILNKEF